MDWLRLDPDQEREFKSMLSNRLIKNNYYQVKVYVRLHNNDEIFLLGEGEIALLKL